MFGLRKYNYESFSRDLLRDTVLEDQLAGPAPGERAPDFKARGLDGNEVSLGDYRGRKNVVLMFGSATCPFTNASISGMNRLFDRYADEDVEFLFLYVREAHPGERLPAHRSMEEKQRAAELFRQEEEVEMPVLVDDLRGSIHRKYGKLPNSTYLIDKAGRIAFRCLWTRSRIVHQALQELLEAQHERGIDHLVVLGGEDTDIPSRQAMLSAHRALERGGLKAVRNFRREMGMRGRAAVTAGTILQPAIDYPGRAAGALALTAAVVTGGIWLGYYLRRRRFPIPYDAKTLGVPRRSGSGSQGDYEAVGI